MKKRLMHKSTFWGVVLIAVGLLVGFKAQQWETATSLMLAGCGAIGYKPKEKQDA